MDTQKLLLHLPDPVSDQPRYGTSSGGSSMIAYQRIKNDHPRTAAAMPQNTNR